MIFSRFVCFALPSVAMLAVAAYAQTPDTSLPLNKPTTVSGIEAVCTGVAVNPEDLPRWNTYPLKLLVTGKGGQFLGGEIVTLTQKGKTLTQVSCSGPWLLFKLVPGEYRIGATLEGKTMETNVRVPKTGQGRALLSFSNSGGGISPEHKPGD